MGKAISEDRKKRILKMYEDGVSQADIARAFGMTPQGVYQLLKAMKQKAG